MIGVRSLAAAAVVAVAVSLAAIVPSARDSGPARVPPSDRAVHDRLTSVGFQLSHRLPLTRGRSHQATLFRHRELACDVMVLSMAVPDEVLAVLRQRLNPEAWSRHQLWVADARYRIDSAWEVHWHRLRHRLLGDRVGGGPYLVVPATTCPAGLV